jgi:hypothetical protein
MVGWRAYVFFWDCEVGMEVGGEEEKEGGGNWGWKLGVEFPLAQTI